MTCSPSRETRRSDFPKNWRFIVDLIGIKPARRLIIKYSGKAKLYIPKTFSYDCEICLTLGAEAFRALQHAYSGDCISVPNLFSLDREKRNRSLVLLYTKGTPVASLARQFNLTERHIWTILKTTEL